MTLNEKDKLMKDFAYCFDGFKEAINERNFGDADGWYRRLVLYTAKYIHDDDISEELAELTEEIAEPLKLYSEKLSEVFNNHLFAQLIGTLLNKIPNLKAISWNDWEVMKQRSDNAPLQLKLEGTEANIHMIDSIMLDDKRGDLIIDIAIKFSSKE